MSEEDIKRGASRRVDMRMYRDMEGRAYAEKSILDQVGGDIIGNMEAGKWYTVRYDTQWDLFPGGFGDFGDMRFTVVYKLNPAIVEKLRVVETDYASMPPFDLALTAVDEFHRRMRRRFSWWRKFTLPRKARDFVRAVAPWHYAEEDARKERIWRAIKDKVK